MPNVFTAHRALGAALLVGSYVPLHRLLDPVRAGPAEGGRARGGESTCQNSKTGGRGTGREHKIQILGGATQQGTTQPPGP